MWPIIGNIIVGIMIAFAWERLYRIEKKVDNILDYVTKKQEEMADEELEKSFEEFK